MGKIADALGKNAQEHMADRLPGLTRVDLEVLLNYNRENGHLLNYDRETGQVGNLSMEVFRNRGTIQRLMDHKLIFPGGKLTPKGLYECKRLQQRMPAETPPVTADEQTVQKPADQTRTADAPARSEADARTALQSPKLEPPPIAQPERAETPQLQETALKDIPLPKPQPREEPPPVPHQQKPATPETKMPAVNGMPSVRPAVIEKTPVRQPVQQEHVIDNRDEKAIAKDDERAAKVPEADVKKVDKPARADQPHVTMPGAIFDENAIDENLISLRDPQSYEAEQFKILRTNLLFPVSGEAPRSILVTGALPGDGKSFVSANLAVSIALNINQHVLLIDCDLRKPDIHRIFGFGDVPGLSEYLMGHKDFESLLLKSAVDKLTLLPGGSVPPNPSELMSTERMSELLAEVKFRYHDRLIILDSPPPALAAETAFLARYVDGIILVVKQGSTPREEVEDLMNAVGTEKILGCVINQLDVQVSRYYGRKKYSKYGKRYYK